MAAKTIKLLVTRFADRNNESWSLTRAELRQLESSIAAEFA